MSHLHHRVSALVDGELSPAARRRALAHLERCEECRGEVASVLSVKRALSGLPPVEPSHDLSRELCGTQTLDCAGSRESLDTGRRRVRVAVTAGALASATGVVLAVAYALGGAPDPVQVRPDVEAAILGFAGLAADNALSDPTPTQDGAPVPVAPLATPQPVRGVVDDGATRARAVRLLRRAAEAPWHHAYVGVRQVDLWDARARTRLQIEHVPGEGTSVSVPSSTTPVATFVSETSGASTPSVSVDVQALSTMLDSHEVAVAGPCLVAGRRCTVVQVTRGGTLDARYLVDNATGVLLGREQYVDGTLSRSSRFTSVQVRRSGFLAHVPPVLSEQPTTRLSAAASGVLTDEGWRCPSRLGPFALVRVDAVPARHRTVTRFVYSDGISLVAVTEQHGDLDPSGLVGFRRVRDAGEPVAWVRSGLPDVRVWGHDGLVYTLVSTAPTQVDADLARRLTGRSTTDDPGRLSRGLDRLVSAVVPG